MRKKMIVCLLLMMVFLAGCGNKDVESEVSTITGGINSDIEKTMEGSLASQMNVEEYYYENGVGDTLYFLVVTNNSEKTVELMVEAIAKDSDSNTVGTTDSEMVAVGAGEEACLLNYFESVEDAYAFEYTLKVTEDKNYKSVMNDLEVAKSGDEDTVVVSCTNISDNAIPLIDVSGLFFENGKLIGYNEVYIGDDDSELKPGATLSEQLTYDEEFDEVKVFIHTKKRLK